MLENTEQLTIELKSLLTSISWELNSSRPWEFAGGLRQRVISILWDKFNTSKKDLIFSKDLGLNILQEKIILISWELASSNPRGLADNLRQRLLAILKS